MFNLSKVVTALHKHHPQLQSKAAARADVKMTKFIGKHPWTICQALLKPADCKLTKDKDDKQICMFCVIANNLVDGSYGIDAMFPNINGCCFSHWGDSTVAGRHIEKNHREFSGVAE